MSRQDRYFVIMAIIAIGAASWVFFTLFAAPDDAAPLSPSVDLADAASAGDVQPLARRHAVPQRRPAADVQAEAAPSPPEPISLEVGARRIAGHVEDEAGRAVEGATIKSTLYFPPGELNFGAVSRHEATADSDEHGAFAIDVPGHGVYRLLVTHGDHAPLELPEVHAGDEVRVSLTAGGRLAGRVVEAGSDRPVAQARVTLKRRQGVWSKTVATGDDGRFDASGLPRAALLVEVVSFEHVALRNEPISLADEPTAEATFELERGRVITGTVLGDRGRRVAGAEVAVGDKKVATDDLGAFRLPGLGREAHRLTVVADGFLTARRTVNLSGSREEACIEVPLSRGGTVRGSVIGESGGPVEGADVKVFRTWGTRFMQEADRTRYRAKTDGDGLFEIKGLDLRSWAKYKVRASFPGYADSYSDAVRPSKKEPEVSVALVLRTGGVLSGTIRDEQQRPLAGVKVTLSTSRVYEWSDAGRREGEVTLTDDRGRYSFARLAPQRYRLSASARGHASKFRRNIRIAANQVLEGVDLELENGCSFAGTVETEDGEPVAEAKVWVKTKSSWAQAVTDEHGEYEIGNVGEGPYDVTVRATGFSRERKKKVFPIGGRIDFELRRDGYVEGVVRERATERAVRSFRVELQKKRRDGRWRSERGRSVSDVEGRFKLYAPDGTYRLVVKARGYIDYQRDGVRLSVDAEPEVRTIELTPGGSIEGWVRDHMGRPFSGVQIYTRSMDDPNADFERRTRTESDGYYFVGSLETGAYELAFHRSGRAPLQRRAWVHVGGGSITEVSAALEEPSAVRVSVRDADDNPVKWTQFEIATLGEEPVALKRVRRGLDGSRYRGSRYRPALSSRYWVDRRGVKSVLDLPAGAYRLTASRGGYEKIVTEFEISRGESVDFDFTLERKHRSRRRGATR